MMAVRQFRSSISGVMNNAMKRSEKSPLFSSMYSFSSTIKLNSHELGDQVHRVATHGTNMQDHRGNLEAGGKENTVSTSPIALLSFPSP